MAQTKLVVFDLDGTLFNTLADLTNAVNYAMSTVQARQFEQSEVRRMIGNGAEILISRALPYDKQHLLDEAYNTYSNYYDNHLLDNTTVYEGIPQLLDTLHSNGITVGVFSNKADKQVKLLCDTLLSGKVDYAVGRQKGGARKPDPFGLLDIMQRSGADSKHTVFVGDSTVDIDTAANGNVPCISVDWGYNDHPQLVEHGANIIVSNAHQLLEALLQYLHN